MTHRTTQANANRQAQSTTTKSHCPAGAGFINQGEATKGAHTPPQACATPTIDRAIATTSKAPHAQLAKGYKQVEESCVQVPITWVQALYEHNNIANNTPPSADPSVRAKVFAALETCNDIIEGMHHLVSTTETPATTGKSTTEETAMTASKEQIVQGFLAAESQRFDAVTHPLTLGEKQVALRAVDYTITALAPEEQANTIRAQFEVIQGLAGLLRAIRDQGYSEELAQEIHQVLQTYAPCNTCGGADLECPDCDGVRYL